MAGFSLSQVEKGFYDALVADSALTTALGGAKVYSIVPQNTAYPYVALGRFTGREFSTKTFNGLDSTFTMDIFTQERSRKNNLDIQALVYDALHEQPISVTNNVLVTLRMEFTETFIEDGRVSSTEDLITVHGVLRFRIRTTQT